MGPTYASRSTHPQEGLSRDMRCLGSPTWPQGSVEGTELGQACMGKAGITLALQLEASLPCSLPFWPHR